jgi:hypothetical protein
MEILVLVTPHTVMAWKSRTTYIAIGFRAAPSTSSSLHTHGLGYAYLTLLPFITEHAPLVALGLQTYTIGSMNAPMFARKSQLGNKPNPPGALQGLRIDLCLTLTPWILLSMFPP